MNNVNLKDKSKVILEKINEIKGCLDKLVDKESLISEKAYNTCQSCLEEITEEIAPYAQGNMPELEDGMYGIIVDNRCEHKNYKFRVARGCIFMDNGWVYGVDDFEDGFYNDLDIVEISTGVESFDQYHYGTVVWTVVYNES